MSDAWLRVVADDAPDHQKLGAITISELAAQNLEDCLGLVFAKLDAFMDEVGISEPEQRARARQKVEAVVRNTVSTNVEKIKLRLQGREPMH